MMTSKILKEATNKIHRTKSYMRDITTSNRTKVKKIQLIKIFKRNKISLEIGVSKTWKRQYNSPRSLDKDNLDNYKTLSWVRPYIVKKKINFQNNKSIQSNKINKVKNGCKL